MKLLACGRRPKRALKGEEEEGSSKKIKGKAKVLLEEESDADLEPKQVHGKGRTRKPEQDGKKKRKEVQAQSPFTVPPSKMTAEIFDIQNPFIHRMDGSVVIPNLPDKVLDGKAMDDAALQAAILAMLNTPELFSCAFKSPSSEIGGRPHHSSLAAGFWLISKPHQPSVYSSFEEYQEAAVKATNKQAIGAISGDENQEDLKIAQKTVSLSGDESNESLDVRQEGDDGESAQGRIRYDMNFMVYDKNLEGPDKRVTALIVDCTWTNLSTNKICQVASYGCKYAIKNMEKGRFSPIYLELWGELQWRYAILYPKGVVVIEDGQIAATSFKCSNMDILESLLEKKKDKLMEKFPDFPYPDGSYLEGSLYIPNEKFFLPNFAEEHLLNIEQTQLFYQSKIRIIVGDKALQWTEEHVKERIASRMTSQRSREHVKEAWKPISENKVLRRRAVMKSKYSTRL